MKRAKSEVTLSTVFIIALVIVGCQPKTVNHYSTPGGANSAVRTADGTVDGGGGKGVLCKDPKTGKETVEVLDLYEGEVVYGFKPRPYTGKSELKILEDLVIRIQKRYGDTSYFPAIYKSEGSTEAESDSRDIQEISQSKDLIDYIQKNIDIDVSFVDQDTELKDTQDSLEPFVNKNCEVVQLAVYYNEDRLLISQKYWDRLSAASRVALFFHEIIYKQERLRGIKDSKTVRKFVSAMMAENLNLKPLQYRSSPPTDDYLYCTIQSDTAKGQSGKFYIYDDIDPDDTSRKVVTIQFIDLRGYSSNFRRTGKMNSLYSIQTFDSITAGTSHDVRAPDLKSVSRVEQFYEELSKNQINLSPLVLEFNKSGQHKILGYKVDGDAAVDAAFTCSSANVERVLRANEEADWAKKKSQNSTTP